MKAKHRKARNDKPLFPTHTDITFRDGAFTNVEQNSDRDHIVGMSIRDILNDNDFGSFF